MFCLTYIFSQVYSQIIWSTDVFSRLQIREVWYYLVQMSLYILATRQRIYYMLPHYARTLFRWREVPNLISLVTQSATFFSYLSSKSMCMYIQSNRFLSVFHNAFSMYERMSRMEREIRRNWKPETCACGMRESPLNI